MVNQTPCFGTLKDTENVKKYIYMHSYSPQALQKFPILIEMSFTNHLYLTYFKTGPNL